MTLLSPPVVFAMPSDLRSLCRASLFAAALAAAPFAPAQGTVTVQLQDYVAMPITGTLTSTAGNSPYAARVNFLREEPGGGTNRFFLNDLNGKLYILDKTTKTFATYLDFNRNTTETPGATGLFPAFTSANGYANGLVTFQFDPEYRVVGSPNYGKFYTVHIETDTADGAATRLPNASTHPGFTNAASYTSSSFNAAPGTTNANTRHAILIEWQDTNPNDAIFQGTAREVLRIQFNGRIHPMGDLLFNPLATSSAHADWRKLYIAVGDGGAGEQNVAVLHPTPQRLDVLQGKILRLSPDDPDGAGPLRYGIPTDNPFASTNGARGEIYAYGFRNPHRLSWDATTNLLIATDIGFHTWEEVNLIRRGVNYGWAEREGTFALNLVTGIADSALPATDATNNYVYPVIQYPHSPSLGYGDAICGGFVYRGTRLPQLQGKFVFGDITTGQVFYADLAAMIAADDGNPATLAAFQRIEFLWTNPRNSAAGLQRFDRMYEIVAREYHARGGPDADLPGSAIVSDLTGGGRADIRLALDAAGELYLLSKSDGMVRALVSTVVPAGPPVITTQPVSQTIAAGGTVIFNVEATNAAAYRWKRNGVAINGADGALFTLPSTTSALAGSYTVEVSNAAGTATSVAAILTVASATDSNRVVNFAIRSSAGTGSQTLIVGLSTSSGSEQQSLLIRAVGPGLTAFGVAGALADPRIALFRGSIRLTENDDWETAGAQIATLGTQVGAFALAPRSKDAALSIFQTAATTSGYTVQVSGAPGQTGTVLAEIYDATAPGTLNAPQLLNVSARTLAGAGDDTLIAGFVIGGSTARSVLIRAAGPALTAFGVTGVVSDPRLSLYKGSTKIAENDNWPVDPALVNAFSSVGAFAFTARSKDAVLYLTLAPGAYTAQVSSVTGTAGVGLVEVYVLP